MIEGSFPDEPALRHEARKIDAMFHSLYPEEGDYIISSCGPLGSMTRVSVVGDSRSRKVFGGEKQAASAWAYITERMTKENFYPNIWHMSDHGNFEIAGGRRLG
jgi:hypothetical protein